MPLDDAGITQQMFIGTSRVVGQSDHRSDLWHPPLRPTEVTIEQKPCLHAKGPYKRPLSHTMTTKLSAPLARAHLETAPDQIMTPNIITEAHSHSFGSRMTVAQRKEAHELRKVRMILGSFEHPEPC